MRKPISGVKLGLQCFLLPCGMCALSALVTTELNCAIDVSMLVIYNGVEHKKLLFCLLHE